MNNYSRYTYKAKRIDNGEWVYGHFIKVNETDKYYMLPLNENIYEGFKANYFQVMAIEIIPETLCQCTGLQDFYEHDLVKYKNEKTIYEIVWFEKECYFGLKAFNISYGTRENEMLYYEDTFKYLEKVGNKFDKENIC